MKPTTVVLAFFATLIGCFSEEIAEDEDPKDHKEHEPILLDPIPFRPLYEYSYTTYRDDDSGNNGQPKSFSYFRSYPGFNSYPSSSYPYPGYSYPGSFPYPGSYPYPRFYPYPGAYPLPSSRPYQAKANAQPYYKPAASSYVYPSLRSPGLFDFFDNIFFYPIGFLPPIEKNKEEPAAPSPAEESKPKIIRSVGGWTGRSGYVS